MIEKTTHKRGERATWNPEYLVRGDATAAVAAHPPAAVKTRA